VLFLGMVRRGEFESLQKRNLRLGVLVDTNSKARLGDVSGFAVVERFDFSRPTAELLEAVRDIGRRFGIACLFNVVEFYVAATAVSARRTRRFASRSPSTWRGGKPRSTA